MKYWDQWIVGFLPVDLLLQQVSHLYNQLRLTRMMLIRRKMTRMRRTTRMTRIKRMTRTGRIR